LTDKLKKELLWATKLMMTIKKKKTFKKKLVSKRNRDRRRGIEWGLVNPYPANVENKMSS